MATVSPVLTLQESDDTGVDIRSHDVQAGATLSEQCTPLYDYLKGPDAYRLDVWGFSWGAPPVGQNPDPARAYALYDDATLDGLIASGDSLALHERGLSLIWMGLNGRQRAPTGVTLWDLGSDDFPYSTRIDAVALQRGRDLLYEAAVKGRSYDLLRIGLSFAHEKRSRMASGVDEALLDELDVQKFAYSLAIKGLVPGLGKNYIQSSISDRQKIAGKAAAKGIVDQVVDDRKRQGIPLYLPRDDSAHLRKSLNICGD